MILDKFKAQVAEIYYLANTPSYIYRNIVNTFSNVDLRTISECELDDFEDSITDHEVYLFYLVIYIRIRNNFEVDKSKYKCMRWCNEYITYCKVKQTNTSTYSFSIDEVSANV
jgi:hypothetical protein